MRAPKPGACGGRSGPSHAMAGHTPSIWSTDKRSGSYEITLPLRSESFGIAGRRRVGETTNGMKHVPAFTIPFVIGLATGFILGYGVRAIIPYRRHQRARRQSYLF